MYEHPSITYHMFVLVRAKKYLSRNYSQLLFYSGILYFSKYYCYWHVPTVVGVSSSLLISCPCCRCWICLKRWSTIKRFQSVKLAFIYTSKSCSLTQWMNSVPPYVRKLHFMYEVVRTSSKCRWSIYRTSSKCHWSIFVHQHWNGNVFILMKFSSLAALEVVKMTTSSAASD